MYRINQKYENEINEGGKINEIVKVAKRRNVMRRLIGFRCDKED